MRPVKRTLAFKNLGLVVAAVVLYALHQDVWFFKTAYPLFFGFLPIGLAYHAAYSVACALLMWLLVAQAWPSHLEDEAPDEERRPPEP
jgi:hypothetical protein